MTSTKVVIMIENQEIYHFIQTLVVNRFGVEEDGIHPSMAFSELGADSLDIVEMVMEIEHKFDIHFSDERLAKLKTIEEAVTYIDELKR